MSQPIFVTTPTGNIGSKIVTDLVDRGEDVHVLVRNPDRLSASLRDRITIHVGDLFDTEFVTEATRGTTALFWLTPPLWDAEDVPALYAASAHSVQTAVTANAIPHVVHLSSLGAENDGYGPISLLRKVEDALNATGADVVHLRPGFFFENFAEQTDPIRNAGAIFLPLSPSSTMPMVATADIARVAADLLSARTFSGKSYRGVHGPADLSMTDVAGILSAVLGKEIAYVQTTPEAARATFLELGASPAFADLYVEMFDALSHRSGPPAEPRSPLTTTPTTLHTWAEEVIKPLVVP